MSHVQLPLYIGHKTSAFGVHEGGKLMVAACFGKREHLEENTYIKKKRVGDDHPKNLVR